MTKDEIIEKLWSKTIIDPKTNCQLWKGSIYWNGYGQIYIHGISQAVHIVAYKLLIGKPKNLVLHNDKLCNHKNCWNPEHLYDGTQSDNMIDRHQKWTHYNSDKTHCPQNHEFTNDNTGYYRGTRYCKTCKKERQRKRK